VQGGRLVEGTAGGGPDVGADVRARLREMWK
jgi:hypothetical protein